MGILQPKGTIGGRRLRRRRLGATVLEMAVILPIFLAITFGIIDWAWVFFVRHTMYQAARASARSMAVQEMTASEGESLAHQILTDAYPNYTFTVNVQNTVDPEIRVEITVPSGDVDLTGFTSALTSTLNATVVMQREGL